MVSSVDTRQISGQTVRKSLSSMVSSIRVMVTSRVHSYSRLLRRPVSLLDLIQELIMMYSKSSKLDVLQYSISKLSIDQSKLAKLNKCSERLALTTTRMLESEISNTTNALPATSELLVSLTI